MDKVDFIAKQKKPTRLLPMDKTSPGSTSKMHNSSTSYLDTNINLPKSQKIPINNANDSNIMYSKSAITQQQDNEGGASTQSQVKYFKDSKARDDNVNLVTVFHTMTDEGVQFNEFNPVGTDHYRFGNQVVNYYTDSKEMAGSYANQYYEMADTKKITSLKQVDDYIKKVNEYDGYHTIELEEKNGKYYLVDNSKLGNDDRTKITYIKKLKNIYMNMTTKQLKPKLFIEMYPSTIKAILGHSTSRDITSTYIHKKKDELCKAVERIHY